MFKHLKTYQQINEELSSDTYRKASYKLRYMGYDKRADKIHEHRLRREWEEALEEYKNTPIFEMEVRVGIAFIYGYYHLNMVWNEDGIDGKSIDINLIPADEESFKDIASLKWSQTKIPFESLSLIIDVNTADEIIESYFTNYVIREDMGTSNRIIVSFDTGYSMTTFTEYMRRISEGEITHPGFDPNLTIMKNLNDEQMF